MIKKEEQLILKLNANDMFFNYIKNYNIESYYTIDYNGFLFKVIKKLNLPIVPFFLNEWKKDINKYKQVILFDTGFNNQVTKYIKKYNKECKIILYYWNPVKEYTKEFMQDRNVDEVWSFDIDDVNKYNLKYNPQFYTEKIVLKNIENKYDFVFLGRNKNRKEQLMDLKNKFENENVNGLFKIIEKEKDLLPYNEYLDLIAESKSILDIVSENQSGLTLRPIEALFLNKKLITNNRRIKEYDFYNENNIFILGERNIKDLKSFIDSEYIQVDENIRNKYDFENWLKNFSK